MLRRIVRRLRKYLNDAPVSAVTAPSVTAEAVHQSESVVDEDSEPTVNVEIDTEQLKGWLTTEESFTLVDIREPHELRSGHAKSALLLRMNDIPNRIDELPSKDTRLVIYCAAGSRSFGVAHWLREQGWTDSWSLESGFYGVTEAGMDVIRPDETSD